MNIEYQKAKNGELTASINNQFLHSSYNPSREAERFVESLNITYNPPLIIIIEPCLSYIIPYIKIRFKDSKIAVIRIENDFSDYNKDIDFLISFEENKNNFSEYLYNLFGEELLLSAYFIQWQPAVNVYKNEINIINNEIKKILEQSKTLLVTREYFEKKWFINSINFLNYLHHTITINKKITVPIVIISSGPSLKDSLEILKINRNKIFIICLSSAIKPLLKNNIIPDLCMSTDGGYWAGQHLKSLNKYNIPLAISIEGYLQKNILQNNKIIPLYYKEGLSSFIINHVNLTAMEAERNGTVSGSALLFALNNSISDIYFCGLDLANCKGYQHTQPNELEINNSIKDNKLYQSEKRAVISEYNKGSLNIYKNWFSNYKKNQRNIYRVINNKYKQNDLGQINDISVKEFSKKLNLLDTEININYFTETNFSINKKLLIKYIKSNIFTDEWKKLLYPLSFTALTHNEKNTDIINRLNEETKSLSIKIEKILNE